jgi:O-antigen/teichoic acid export membrane protein
MTPPSLPRLWRTWGPTARQLVSGSTSGLLLSATNRVMAVGSGVLLARALGIDQFGIYSLAIAVAMVFGTFVELGLPTLVVREVARADLESSARDHDHVRDAVLLTLGSSLVAAAILGLGLSILALADKGDEQRAALLLVTALLPVSAVTRILAAGLMARRYILQAQLAEFFVAPAIMLAGATALSLHLAQPLAEAAIAIQIGANAVGAICAGAWLKSASLSRTAAAFARTRAKMVTLARAGLPFLLANIALLLGTQVDTVVVGMLGSSRDVALYRIGAQGAMLCIFVIQVLQNVAAPFIARFHQGGDSAAVRRIFRTIQVITFGFSLALTIAFAVAGGELIAFLFGPAYVSAQPILVIISIGYLLNAACGPIGMLLSMTGHERAMSRIVWTTAVANIGAAIVLGLLWGATGVAVATALSVAGYHLLMRLYARRFFEL